MENNKILNIYTYLETLRQKGYLAYEYNPFHNYQTKENLYEHKLSIGKVLIPEGKAVDIRTGEILTKINDDKWINSLNNIIDIQYVVKYNDNNTTITYEKGSLIDLDSDLLLFDLNHPIDIEVLPSYDGSVNLILNDNKNIPRLINSRFSVREKNTYEIVDRIGENDTNIYTSDNFDKDTSLYFLYKTNPKIEYKGFISGILSVGQYCFYFTYCDADDNESDIIAESGLIPVFVGMDNDPYSMDGGIKNQSSNKGIKLKLTNLDSSYNYIKVYYVRYFADYLQNRVYSAKKLYHKYAINSNELILQINGHEEGEDIDPNILNLTRFNPKHILTLALCKNMLFFGNITKITDNYKELSDCALRIVPVAKPIDDINYNSKYNSGKIDNYYRSSNIYNKVGYFNDEYYRFGVVFIYLNGTLSNVYNTLGYDMNGEVSYNNDYKLFTKENSGIYTRNFIKTTNEGWIVNDKNNNGPLFYNENNVKLNSKGVCKIKYKEDINHFENCFIEFIIPDEVKTFLRDSLGIRGLFFVRLKRIPNLLTQCLIFPIDTLLKVPTLIKDEEINGNLKRTKYTECFVTKKLTVNEINEKLLNSGLNPNNFGDRPKYMVLKSLYENIGLEIDNSYDNRLYEYNSDLNIGTTSYVGICPDFLLDQPYYNQIFNGSRFKLKKVTNNSKIKKDGRYYEWEVGDYIDDKTFTSSLKISTVTEDVPTIALNDLIYKLNIGEAEEAFRFEYAQLDRGTYDAGNEDKDLVNKSSNIVRGKYSPYLAIDGAKLEIGEIYNIYQDNYLDNEQLFLDRMNSSDPFYAISERYNWDELGIDEYHNNNNILDCYRGDCYLNTFTYRLNRNFNDPSLPNNDKIIDKNTWKDNYDAFDLSKWENISRSDLNAVQMGSWITFNVKSSYNYALRSEDKSYVSETELMGSPRSFFPRKQNMWLGTYKMPDSYLYNDAYRATLGYKCYFTLDNINYIKDTFSNRILYSAIAIQDSFKNNYRESFSTYFRDYSMEYGSIQKLIGFEGYLLVVFEHGIGVAVINERILAGEGDGEPVFINTRNVLPEELTIITDTYGTQWPESVVKSEAGYVYGVDTIAKKIWRVKGLNIEILSDFKVNKFLVDNITLGEREKNIIIGLKNVKTHYNNNKKDVMFTFYDNLYLDEEKSWNLCYNELLGEFITFYSWIPSYSENIDTLFFTFDRETSKALSLINYSNFNILSNTGILLNTPILEDIKTVNDWKIEPVEAQEAILYANEIEYNADKNKSLTPLDFAKLSESEKIKIPAILSITGVKYTQEEVNNYDISTNTTVEIYYRDSVKPKLIVDNLDLLVSESDVNELFVVTNCKFELIPNHWHLDKYFKIVNDNILKVEDVNKIKEYFSKYKVGYLTIRAYIEITDLESNNKEKYFFGKEENVAITLRSIVNNSLTVYTNSQIPDLTTNFYLHGLAGIFDISENLYPTHWYGEFHPFEFEFVVNDKIGLLKIFTNLVIISNKAEPESFHFEIEGDNYDFSSDKRAMYFRLEATKKLYLNLGSDILFNRYYTDVIADKYTYELYYRGNPKRRNEEILSNSEQYTNLYKNFDRVYPIDSQGLVQLKKSTIFPLYYERIDTFNDIYHKYLLMKEEDGIYDFLNLSGSEISWNRDLNLFNVITHIKNSPIDQVGRLRGNSMYKEGKWDVLIPSIIFNLKNEDDWTNGIPPIIINSLYVPNDLTDPTISFDKLPNIYSKTKTSNIEDYVLIGNWTYRKETKIRDKWMKVRVRYSGKNLAVIHSLITLYNVSYS